ncbi:MAG: hypothetical protein JWQ62_1718 [Lacunisphaera sp.]|nr:hypothetical protein [Lacunisphaera sp.]
MQVSFIIPLHNCLPLTQAMLASLRATLPPGLGGEIILVDDGSTDGTRAWLQNLPAPCRVLLNERNLGFAATCNRGAATAAGKLLFFLNNDLVLGRRWLEPMLAAFARFPDAGLVGNVQRNAATGALDHAGIFFNHKGKPAHDVSPPGLARWRQVAALTGACFGIRREVWEELGGFDEGFVNGSEDIDLCLRARRAGFRNLIALRSVVRHHISASAGRKLRDEQNTFRLVARWQDEIAGLAARHWSQHLLAQHLDQSFVFDYPLLRDAFVCWLGILPSVPASVNDGVRAAIALELARWQQLCDTPESGEAVAVGRMPRVGPAIFGAARQTL